MSSPKNPNTTRVVLVSPKGPDNVGSIARVMKNFGLSQLHIIAPRCDLRDAHMMAVHAQDVLEHARIHDNLLEAVGDCDFVVGTTARVRRDHSQPQSPQHLVAALHAAHAPALVFGREEHGLYNEELDLCHAFIKINSNPDYSSLNLAMAVGVTCYELFGRETEEHAATKPEPIATRATLEPMYAHLLEYMLEIGFTDAGRQNHMLRHFRQLLDRRALHEDEVRLLRGLLSQGLWASRKARGEGVPGSVPWPRATPEDS